MIADTFGPLFRSRLSTGNPSRSSFTPSTHTFNKLPANNSLQLMTTAETPFNCAETLQGQSSSPSLATQLQDWPVQAFKTNDDVAMLSDSSSISGGSSESHPINLPQVAGGLKISERTPLCRFFKHGELIRKPTLSKARKRKSAPIHKKEIFGSPFDADYFAKPLATGLSSDRIISRDLHAKRDI